MIDVFNYQNYRPFLLDFFNDKKKEGKEFTHRGIAQKLGVSSTGFIANVLSGRNNLTAAHVATFRKILELKNSEADYFEALVFFCQAKTLDEKNMFYSKILKLQKSKFTQLREKQLSLFAKWHYAIIRELIYFYRFKGNYKELGKMLVPPVSPEDAQDAVFQLEYIGLLQKDNKNEYAHKEGTVTTGNEI